MFALLGEVQFEIIGSPSSFVSSRRYDYAVHRVVQDRPKLQWLAPDLEVLRFELLLHRAFTNPAANVATLLVAAEAHQVLPLIFGSGEFRGNFVITQLTSLSHQLSGDGALIAITVRVELLESPLDSSASLSGVSGFIPLANSALSTLAGAGGASSANSGASGLSPLIALSGPVGTLAAGFTAADVPVAAIVRKVS